MSEETVPYIAQKQVTGLALSGEVFTPDDTPTTRPTIAGYQPDAPPLATPTTLDDVTLVREAQQDLQKFTELYERYVPRVYRYLLARVGNVADAQDLTSQTFIAAMENLDRYQGQRPFLAWLFGIARNKVADYYRRSRPETNLDEAEAVPDSGERLDDMVDQRLNMELVAHKLRTIAPNRAEAISLRLIAGLEVTDVSRLMGKNESAVRILLHRGLRDLQMQLCPMKEKLYETTIQMARH